MPKEPPKPQELALIMATLVAGKGTSFVASLDDAREIRDAALLIWRAACEEITELPSRD